MGTGARISAFGRLATTLAAGLAVAGCASTAASVAPSHSLQAPSPTPAAATPVPSLSSLSANGRIVFYRTDDARTTDTPFVIDPDGSGEIQLHDGGLLPGIPSPDGKLVAVRHLVADPSPAPGAETAWGRPAVVKPDGTGFRVLDAYQGRQMHLDPVGWTADGARIIVQSGGEDVLAADMGLYSIRASDGSDLTRILQTPAGYNDHVVLSRDRSRVLITRASTDFDRALFVANIDGTNVVRLTPPKLNVVDLEFYDGISSDWSPYGTSIVFGAQIGGDPPGLYLVKPDGSDLHLIVSPEIGAVSAQWSPTGAAIAFTSKLRAGAQVWVVSPDGQGRSQLTPGGDGSTSAVPIWSPDGQMLLFQRQLAGAVTLWTMSADGSDPRQLSPTPLASEYVGGYRWWPAMGT